jgi:hypothetical protein
MIDTLERLERPMAAIDTGAELQLPQHAELAALLVIVQTNEVDAGQLARVARLCNRLDHILALPNHGHVSGLGNAPLWPHVPEN